jgi:hypothetical protein
MHWGIWQQSRRGDFPTSDQLPIQVHQLSLLITCKLDHETLSILACRDVKEMWLSWFFHPNNGARLQPLHYLAMVLGPFCSQFINSPLNATCYTLRTEATEQRQVNAIVKPSE